MAAGALAVLAACGSRSELGDPDERGGSEGDAGGATTTGTTSASSTSSSGAGGAGGAGGAAACNGLEVGLEPTVFEWPAAASELAISPHFTPLQSGAVALTTARSPVESPGAPWGISHVRLDGWGAALSTSTPLRIAAAGGRDFVTAAVPDGERYALARRQGSGPPGEPMVVLPTLDVFDGEPLPGGIAVPAGPARPEHLARWPNGELLLLWEVLPNDGQIAYLGAARLDDGVEVAVPLESGCSLFESQARAIPRDGDALLVTTSGRQAQSCFTDDGIIGPANRVQVGLLDRESLQLSVTEDAVFDEPIVFLEVTPRTEGAWVFTFAGGSTLDGPPTLQAQRIDADGRFAGEPVTAIGADYAPPFGIVGWGDGFAVAHFDLFDPGPPSLVVRLFDAEGELVTEASTTTPLPGPNLERDLAMAVGPDDRALLVGWSQGLPAGPFAFATGLVRFDCLP